MCKIIAATNRDLQTEVEKGNFREDLFYRLNMVELNVPTLRERREDIPEFLEFFSRKFAAKYNRELWRPSAEELQKFCEYRWPGNVRQLAHVIEQAYVLDCAPSLPNDDRLPPGRFGRSAVYESFPFATHGCDAGHANHPRAQRPCGTLVGRASEHHDAPATADSGRG